MNSGYLRRAVEEDMDLLFEWANDAVVRRNSFTTDKITYEEHKRWFTNILSDSERHQYIYIYDNEPIGQVRITVDNEVAEIGYSICAGNRGMGHGELILELICEQVKCDFPQVQKLVGKVKPDNIASQKAFERAGFVEKYYAYEVSVNKPEVSELSRM